MTTDLKRLEWTRRVAFPGAKGIGRTYWAAYHTVLALIHAPPNTCYAWFIPRMNWREHIVPMVFAIMAEHGVTGYTYQRARSRIIDQDAREIVFIQAGRGWQERVWGKPYIAVHDLGECQDAMYYHGYIERDTLENTPSFSCNPGPECIGD